jgi:hypothetical protein
METALLRDAIDANDLGRVQQLMTRDPSLHGSPLGYGGDGALTWVAECRVPREPPGAARLAIAKWMLEHGSDVHQGGDGPLMRAALSADRIPMMELLVAHGADVNARWHGTFPIIFASCEALDPDALRWLLGHGADPNVRDHGFEVNGQPYPGTAIDYVIACYGRSPERMSACIDALLEAGGETRFGAPGVLDLLRGRIDALAALLDTDPALARRHYPELDAGMSGGRRLMVQGGTLLHVAAEFGGLAAAALLLDRGADVDARTPVDDAGVGGHTAIFHAVSQFDDAGLEVARLLIDRGADLAVRVTLPGDYERPEELVQCTPLGYALRFGGPPDRPTVALLRERGAVE